MINPNTKVVPIDHGWANMKTEQDAGVTIQVSNDISETMLKVLLKEASHA